MYGLSYLGGAKYGDLILREHPEGWAAAFFTQKDLFGDPKPIIDKLAQSGRCPAIKLNLRWSDTHTFTRQDFPKIQKEAKRFVDVVLKNPQVRFYFNGAVEHRLNPGDAAKLKDMVLEVIPKSAQYINNPWEGKGAFIGDSPLVLNEVHGSHAKPPRGRYTFDFDGSSCVDCDVESIKRLHSNAEIFWFWHPAFNGRLNTNDKTPRPQRKAWPTADLIDSIIYLHRDKGEDNFKNRRLWKSHADRHETPPEPRAYKPVVIVPERVDRLELVADNGQVVAASGRPQAFNDGRYRYYFDQYGYQLAEKARRIHGKPQVKVRAGKKFIGVVNPAFRAGDFRA